MSKSKYEPNGKRIFREEHKSGYTIFNNDIVTTKMSPEAISILLYCLTKPDDWDFKAENIACDMGFTIHKVRKGTSELQQKGYLNISKFKVGKIFKTVYRIYENPSLNNNYTKKEKIK